MNSKDENGQPNALKRKSNSNELELGDLIVEIAPFKIKDDKMLELCSLHDSSNSSHNTPIKGPKGETKRKGDPPSNPTVNFTLNDVGGLDDQINFLKRTILFPLAHKNELAKWGFIPPKGIMFHGNPGTGKTLLAKAIADELSRNTKTKVTFIYRKGTDCFSPYFGVSSENLRLIFKEAEACKPSLLFFDEIDGLCPSRCRSGHHQHYTSVVTTFLGMMDAIKPGETFVIGATNRLDAVDPALRRPGRFDKELIFHPPDESARINILIIHTRKWKTNKPNKALLAEIAAATCGFNGAYLENLCAQASNCAIQRYKTTNHLEEITGAQLKEIVVFKEDWFQALRVIGRPNTNVFGSVMYIPQSNSNILPLISGMVQGIKNKILKTSPFNENSNSLKSFLIYGPNQVATTSIVPELLSTMEFQKISVYELSNDVLECHFISAVQNVMTQVLTCIKPCILYIPNCDALFSTLSDHERETYLPFLIRKLTDTSNHPVLILGTASRAPCNFPEEAKCIFPADVNPGLACKLGLPTNNERRMFFKTVLNKEAFGVSSKKWDTFFKQMLDTCVKKTEFRTIDYLIELHTELHSTGFRYKIKDEESFKKGITSVIENC